MAKSTKVAGKRNKHLVVTLATWGVISGALGGCGAPPQIELQPSTLKLGTVMVGQRVGAKVTVCNRGGRTLRVQRLRSWQHTVVVLSDRRIRPGKTATLTVQVQPERPGPFRSVVLFDTNDPAHRRVALEVQATVQAPFEPMALTLPATGKAGPQENTLTLSPAKGVTLQAMRLFRVEPETLDAKLSARPPWTLRYRWDPRWAGLISTSSAIYVEVQYRFNDRGALEQTFFGIPLRVQRRPGGLVAPKLAFARRSGSQWTATIVLAADDSRPTLQRVEGQRHAWVPVQVQRIDVGILKVQLGTRASDPTDRVLLRLGQPPAEWYVEIRPVSSRPQAP